MCWKVAILIFESAKSWSVYNTYNTKGDVKLVSFTLKVPLDIFRLVYVWTSKPQLFHHVFFFVVVERWGLGWHRRHWCQGVQLRDHSGKWAKKNLMKPHPQPKLIFSLISGRRQCEFWDPGPFVEVWMEGEGKAGSYKSKTLFPPIPFLLYISFLFDGDCKLIKFLCVLRPFMSHCS